MTSLATFTGSATVSDSDKSVEFEYFYSPPSNISGKLCVVEATFFSWDWGGNGNQTSDYLYSPVLVSTSWQQPFSTSTVTSTTKPLAPLASNQALVSVGLGPTLCRIPDGPHTVRFKIYRPTTSGTISASAGSPGTMFLSLKIIDASGRQPPIGV